MHRRRGPSPGVLKHDYAIPILISVAFILWGSRFIESTSYVDVAGNRYFSLFDDAMISMRYAWNLAHGQGLVWNPGEQVQGYTNLLMTLLMTLAALTFDRPMAVLSIQLLGIPTMLAIALMTLKISDYVFPELDAGFRTLSRTGAFICGLAYYPLAYWSLMGMETGLLTLLALAGSLFALRYAASGDSPALWTSAACFALAFLTRNESILYFALTWGYLALESRRVPGRVKPAGLLLAAGLVAATAASQLAFQYLYYGEALPNTYVLKLTGMPLMLRIGNGLGFVGLFLRETSLLFVLAGVGLILSYRREKLLLLLISLLALLYQIYVGGDGWWYWRFLAPSGPLLLLLSLDALLLIVRWIRRRASSRAHAPPRINAAVRPLEFAAVTICLLAAVLQANGHFLFESLLLIPPFQAVDNRLTVQTALALNDLLKPDATIAVTWAGTIPYYTDFKAIDMLGKSDRYIASLPPDLSGAIAWAGMSSAPGHNKYDLNYSIVAKQPTYVQYVRYGAQDVSAWANTRYVIVEHGGVLLRLLRDSPQVDWSKVALP